MLSSVLKLKKAVMCFMEKIHVLDMLCLGMGAIGCKFNVNESDFTLYQNEDLLVVAAHSCILAWRIPWAEEPGRPWSMGFLNGQKT